VEVDFSRLVKLEGAPTTPSPQRRQWSRQNRHGLLRRKPRQLDGIESGIRQVELVWSFGFEGHPTNPTRYRRLSR
jgi:hypothetical protein